MTAKVQSITGKIEQQETDSREIEARKREAKFHWAQLVNANVLVSKNSLRIGFHARILKEKNLWGMLGHRDENEARLAAGVGESTWYATIRLAEQFGGADEALFTNMKLSNAKELGELPESKREDKQWLTWAAEESISKFKERCDEAMYGKARPRDSQETVRSMKMTMPASRKKVIEEKTKEYAVAVGINPADQAKVIEVALTEVTGGTSLVQAITTTVAKIKEAKELAHSGVSVEEALQQIEKTLDDVILELASALEQASQRTEAA